jgi:hypothetical protein
MLKILRFQERIEEIAAEENGNNDKQDISDHSGYLLPEPFAALEIENAEGKEGEGGENKYNVGHAKLRNC